MEITLSYQGRQVSLSKPETRYGSNLQSFTELINLAFQGVGLEFDGIITELQDESK